MAQGKQGGRNIESSVCQIRKQVPGNQFATTGSACVLIWPWKLGERQGQTTTQTATATETFLVTTSQVVNKSDLNSNRAWKADFLPVKWLGTEKFSLNCVPIYEVAIPSQETTLLLIPTEALHKQKKFSRVRGNELQSARSQLCYQRGSDSEFKATDAKQLLYCYVLLESALSNDKFALQCYLLYLDESGSYFLQAHGSKAKLRTAEDFQSTEKPKGSVILNEDGYIVGFLAFSDKDEIFPLFFPQNVQDDNQPLQVKISPEDTKGTNALLQGCSGRDGEESQRSHASGNGDVNRNQTEENVFSPCSIEISMTDKLKGSDEFEKYSKTSTEDAETDSQPTFEDPDQDKEFEQNEQIIGISNQPSELSYVSLLEEGNADNNLEETEARSSDDGEEERVHSHSQPRSLTQDKEPILTSTMSDDPNNDGTEGKGVSISREGITSAPQNPEVKAPPYTRSYSEQTPMTPRTKKKLQKSYSEMHSMPLKPGALVVNVVMHKPYVIDALSRLLDPTCRGLQNWRHLAQRNDVSTDLELKFLSQERHSRSEAMFKVLAASNPSLPIGTLKCHLQDLQMNKVRDYIACLDDHMTIETFLDTTDPNIPGRVFITLDLVTDEKWRELGIKLEVDRDDLNGIMIDCANQHQNPAGDVIDMICASNPTMTIGQFKKTLDKIKRTDVKNKLGKLEETGTICDLRDNLDLMRSVTSMLNRSDNPRVKNYKDLAGECNISSELYQSLHPPCADSPTKEVINDIVGRKPTYSVEELFTNLSDMKRLDAIEAISCYFVEEDVRTLKRKLKISDE